MIRRVARLSALLVAILVLGGAIAAFAPLPSGPREIIYVIPKGTAAQRAAGDAPTILPARMRFTVGVRDVLVLRNDDDAPASFGPVLLAPGQTYRIPFRAPAEFQLACSLHREGAVGVVVRAEPTPGWPRFTWRLATIFDS